MSDIPKTQKYLQFMHWFQTSQPALYADHWQNIEVVSDEEELRINIINASEDVRSIINELKEYYFSVIKR